MSFSGKNRPETIQKLRSDSFDVLVIGGGITGAGIALDATKRGMKVALVEMQDFAAGTSSRSTKLIHGGLRYLKQLQVGVVMHSGRERAVVYENGPHVTTPEWMLLPMHKGGTFGPLSTSIGLRVYDLLAGVKKDEQKSMLNRAQTIQKAPLVKQEGLVGAGYYVEYRTDDARLTIEVMKKAVELGATVLNYAKGVEFTYNQKDQVNGMMIEDVMSGETFPIRSKKVINATGPWVDENRKKDKAKPNNKHLRLTKGIHLVVDQAHFPLKQAVYFDTEKDKRMIFAVPRNGKTYIGTTDTVYEADKVHPVATAEDRDYIIKAVNYMFPTVQLTKDKVESSWAGIRPLIWEEGKNPSEISRKDEIWESETGLLTIAGGKLTGYRHMAEEIVDKVAELLQKDYGLNFKPCMTKNQPISGGDVGGSSHFQAFIQSQAKKAEEAGLTQSEGAFLAQFYGTNSDVMIDEFKAHPVEDTEALSRLTQLRLWYALNHEGVMTPCDFIIRRTGHLFFNINEAIKEQEGVIAYMKDFFAWDAQTEARMRDELAIAMNNATEFPVQKV
ncbi:glycerol-3-phosphate dehydrogenase [Wohlfahrtiimonas chitiniclastica]|uniref:glycerol-3-phosphate dehydrogenase/oxidase n=1 Tax=Wohlfahrtiimonas chitiniclastica TaxID=400946 RepID=UPI000B984388|nr:FAD-dependent oxidoreductase [Wohlfahrtiimonas chitiniclastica]OYQ90695.1 glycerol-3-phosphate dehydrogenase [Wohlfahrtiimonas chitiniclastica]